MSLISDLLPQIAILGLLLTASGFFSGTEVAMFSLRRVDREQMARGQGKVGSLVIQLLSRPRRLIATLLIGNEVVNVSVSTILASMAPVIYPGRNELELALLTTLTALPMLLLLGEITPKTVAIKSSFGWSRAAARPLWLFSLVVAPVRWVVLLVADVILRPLGVSTRQSILRDLSEEEFKNLVDAGSAEGQVDARERRLIHKVLEFGDKTVGQVMQSRSQIFALSYELPLSRLIREVAERGYSRVPIYQKSLDNIRGILYAKELVLQAAGGAAAHRRLGDLLHEPLYVPRTLPAERLFRMFKQRKIHMALVVNEYGKLSGLVTMDDLLEELFGVMPDERAQENASGSSQPPAGQGRPGTGDEVASTAALGEAGTLAAPAGAAALGEAGTLAAPAGAAALGESGTLAALAGTAALGEAGTLAAPAGTAALGESAEAALDESAEAALDESAAPAAAEAALAALAASSGEAK